MIDKYKRPRVQRLVQERTTVLVRRPTPEQMEAARARALGILRHGWNRPDIGIPISLVTAVLVSGAMPREFAQQELRADWQ